MGESAGASVDGAIVGTSVDAHCRREETIAEAVRDVLSEEGVGAIGRAVQERLCEDGITISERQAYRYVKRYREGGRKALEDARRLPRAKSFVSVDRRLFEIVEGELASQLHKSSGTRGRAIDRVRWLPACSVSLLEGYDGLHCITRSSWDAFYVHSVPLLASWISNTFCAIVRVPGGCAATADHTLVPVQRESPLSERRLFLLSARSSCR